ncbi:MAG: aminodeoxychorismate lyase [Candidatus Dojkabacteria bacterium]|nr:MAG: aminodeoxychorismate lyase [Candidatus Dojkabacteria bacterium]
MFTQQVRFIKREYPLHPRYRNKLNQQKGKYSKSRFVILTALMTTISVVIYGILQVNQYSSFINSKTLNENVVNVTIAENDTLYHIYSRLVQQGLLPNNQIIFIPSYQLYLKLNQFDTNKIQPGTYEIAPHTPVKELHTLFTPTACKQVSIRIKEGLRIEEIADAIQEQLEQATDVTEINYKKDEFINLARNFQLDDQLNFDFTLPTNLEGYLFPDTYFFCVDVSARQIVEKLLKNFEQKVYKQILPDLIRTNQTLNEVIIKASIVEREAYNNDERKIIAWIIDARLKMGKALGIDATSQYGYGYSPNQKTWWVTGDELLQAIEQDNPYNTRKNLGLPPTPISNPGLDAIIAVLNPTQTEYLYYLHDPCGQIHYSRTLDEHNIKVEKYIIRGQC